MARIAAASRASAMRRRRGGMAAIYCIRSAISTLDRLGFIMVGMARPFRSALLVAALTAFLGVVVVACGHHSHGAPGAPGTITISPATAALSVNAGGAPATQAFTATAHLKSGDVDVTQDAIWSLDDYNLGNVIAGAYTSITSHGGMTLLHARWTPPGASTPLVGDASLTLTFHATVTSTCPSCNPFPADTTPACAAG